MFLGNCVSSAHLCLWFLGTPCSICLCLCLWFPLFLPSSPSSKLDANKLRPSSVAKPGGFLSTSSQRLFLIHFKWTCNQAPLGLPPCTAVGADSATEGWLPSLTPLNSFYRQFPGMAHVLAEYVGCDTRAITATKEVHFGTRWTLALPNWCSVSSSPVSTSCFSWTSLIHLHSLSWQLAQA